MKILKPGWNRYDTVLLLVGGGPVVAAWLAAMYFVAVKMQHLPVHAIVQGSGLMIGVVVVFVAYVKLIQWLAGKSWEEKNRDS